MPKITALGFVSKDTHSFLIPPIVKDGVGYECGVVLLMILMMYVKYSIKY